MLSTQKTPENVTECIEILAYNDHLWEGFAPHEKDSKTIRSLAESPYAWTEKQAKLALIIVKRYKTLFEKFKMDINDLCENPVWRDPFRKIDYEKVIEKFTNEEGEDLVEIRFPYNKKLVNLIRNLKDKKGLPTGYMRYDGESKAWTIKYSDVTAYYLTLIGTRYDFKFTDPTMLDDFDEIRKEKSEHVQPSISTDGNKILLKNCSESLSEYWNNNIKSKTLLQQIDKLSSFKLSLPQGWVHEVGTLAEKIAVCSHRDVHIDPANWNREQLLDACKTLDLFPLITPVPEHIGMEDIQNMTNWFHAFNKVGITNEEIAWGCDLAKHQINPPEHDQYIDKEQWDDDPYDYIYRDLERNQKMSIYKEFKVLNLHSNKNKFIHSNTKIIFIRSKIPRTLIKSGIIPNTSLHFVQNSYAPYGETVRKWLDNFEKRMYYSTNTIFGSAIKKI
jgi:hypothetical protein